MAREFSSGGRGKGRGKSTSDKKSGKGKSGWVKPDGTPLRARKGDYFPDKEIDARSRPKSFRRNENSPSRKPWNNDRPLKEEGGERESSDFRKETGSERPAFKKSFGDRNQKRTFDKKPSRGSYRDYRENKRSFDSDEELGSESRTSDKRPYDKKPFERRSDSKSAFSKGSKKPFEKKRERYSDRDHSKEMNSRFDRSSSARQRSDRKPSSAKKSSFVPDAQGAIRLNRFISNAGICSRREADELIVAGVISINGEIVTELGTKVMPGDTVKYHDQTLKTEKPVYVLLNKPKDYITTTDDPDERKTVMSLVADACKERIFPVGRLDRNTTGLLLITNDGELTKRLTHPSGEIKKIYQVELDRNLTQADMLRAAEGVELEDGIAGFDEIQYVSHDDKSVIGVELHSGKNRIVRRIFEAMGYKVRKLDRTTFAGLTKKDLPRGRWRFLTDMEVNMLKMLTGKKRKAAASMELEE